jgi:hypothetical protein
LHVYQKGVFPERRLISISCSAIFSRLTYESSSTENIGFDKKTERTKKQTRKPKSRIKQEKNKHKKTTHQQEKQEKKHEKKQKKLGKCRF